MCSIIIMIIVSCIFIIYMYHFLFLLDLRWNDHKNMNTSKLFHSPLKQDWAHFQIETLVHELWNQLMTKQDQWILNKTVSQLQWNRQKGSNRWIQQFITSPRINVSALVYAQSIASGDCLERGPSLSLNSEYCWKLAEIWGLQIIIQSAFGK